MWKDLLLICGFSLYVGAIIFLLRRKESKPKEDCSCTYCQEHKNENKDA